MLKIPVTIRRNCGIWNFWASSSSFTLKKVGSNIIITRDNKKLNFGFDLVQRIVTSYQVELFAHLVLFVLCSSDIEVSFFFRTKKTKAQGNTMLLFLPNKDDKFGVLKKKNCWCWETIRFELFYFSSCTKVSPQ